MEETIYLLEVEAAKFCENRFFFRLCFTNFCFCFLNPVFADDKLGSVLSSLPPDEMSMKLVYIFFEGSFLSVTRKKMYSMYIESLSLPQ